MEAIHLLIFLFYEFFIFNITVYIFHAEKCCNIYLFKSQQGKKIQKHHTRFFELPSPKYCSSHLFVTEDPRVNEIKVPERAGLSERITVILPLP